MKPLIESAAFLEAFKHANPLPPKINIEIIETPPHASNKKTGIYFWIILGIGLIALGRYLDYISITNKSNKESL
jgi:hypothetical protein